MAHQDDFDLVTDIQNLHVVTLKLFGEVISERGTEIYSNDIGLCFVAEVILGPLSAIWKASTFAFKEDKISQDIGNCDCGNEN
ncbi:hypothetical protein KIN20_031444 [Parelaphostrongylus tenuis]|uniref:Uncharacterized protein n=1 Tax=Parelaphostrongylus tenuis TaxID=148309 RepID=A0AAD5WGT4_PARTN|nr:hypothetical protein KIN20_031444 [Parelaphostrongylus tenuis]